MTIAQKIGWALSGLFALFMLGASALPKLAGMAVATDIMAQLGWPDAPIFLIGLIEAALAILYLVPATSVLASSLLMALLGGAVVTNLRGHADLYGHTLFGVYLGIWLWGGLILRDPRVRAVFPLVR
ncbi:MAG: DoxX family protein [Alphaproteobacteria bacterium]|jgi:hypothetical protein